MSFPPVEDTTDDVGLPSPASSSGVPDEAPVYVVPSRVIAAVEHPLVIKNVDKAIQTFGRNCSYQTILDPASPQISVPLYLRPDNPMTRPLISHNAASHNVVLKITVPKRTGRKRKRGEDGPFQGDTAMSGGGAEPGTGQDICSTSRLDHPAILRRTLEDNVGKYEVEAVGLVKHTHRYRGLADFQYVTTDSGFATKFVNKVLPGELTNMREFNFEPGLARPPGVDLLPPPTFTNLLQPFHYRYAQNPYVKSTQDEHGAQRVVNITARHKSAGFFLTQDHYPAPSAPKAEPDMGDPHVAAIVTALRAAMAERPIWTRRSITNRLMELEHPGVVTANSVRMCIPFVGYQFKGGPWRDALIRYGVDPRADPACRVYQTMIFKLRHAEVGVVGEAWHDIRRAETQSAGGATATSHLFDGRTYRADGKVWQVCDVTDPLLARLFAEADVRPTCDVDGSGWYHRGRWSKCKAIMKVKMLAIRFGRALTDDDFADALRTSDASPPPDRGGNIAVPTPDLQLTHHELEMIRGRKYKNTNKRSRKATGRSLSFPMPGKRARKTADAGASVVEGTPATEDTPEDGPSLAPADGAAEAGGVVPGKPSRKVRFLPEDMGEDEEEGEDEDDDEEEEDDDDDEEGQEDDEDDVEDDDEDTGEDEDEEEEEDEDQVEEEEEEQEEEDEPDGQDDAAPGSEFGQEYEAEEGFSSDQGFQ